MLEGSNYNVRCAVARLLGQLLAATQASVKPGAKPSSSSSSSTPFTTEDMLIILANGFLKGSSRFLKGSAEYIKGSSTVNREVRVGVTHAYVELVRYVSGQRVVG